jgi:hypothetical protein
MVLSKAATSARNVHLSSSSSPSINPALLVWTCVSRVCGCALVACVLALASGLRCESAVAAVAGTSFAAIATNKEYFRGTRS